MKLARLKNLKTIVEKILKEDELAREDDCYLILRTIQHTHPYEVGKIFSEVMMNAKSNGISFESITRARRQVQKKYPELKERDTAMARDNEQEEYIKFSREV